MGGGTMLAQVHMEEWLQYGALGLCAVMVVLNWLDRRAQGRTLDARNARIEQLLTLNIRAWNRVADVFRDRPCVAKDSRIRNLGNTGGGSGDNGDGNGE